MMVEQQPAILWETLELSMIPSQRGSATLVQAQVKAEKRKWPEYGQYRIKVTLGRSGYIVSQTVELLIPLGETDQPTWAPSERYDLAVAIRDYFPAAQRDIARRKYIRSDDASDSGEISPSPGSSTRP